MKVELISIGSELLNGLVANTNSTYLAGRLYSAGYSVCRITAIGDRSEEIIHALEQAEKGADAVICTGGLGPTLDDITKKTVASFFGSQLVFDEAVFRDIFLWLEHRGIHVDDVNREQAFVPDKAELMENSLGTARGMVFTRNSTLFFFLPGVPFEMKKMFSESVLPRIEQEFACDGPGMQIVRTTGIAESQIARNIQGFEASFPGISIGFLPNPSGVRLYLCGHANEQDQMGRALAFLKSRLGEAVYAYGDVSIEQAVAGLLTDHGLTIGVAESCTGGYAANKLTNIPGSSAYFLLGVVAYSNGAKISVLDVNPDTLLRFGAVSRETALEMARGVRIRAGSDIGIATTGIAGPSGGTAEKPVGLVYTAISAKDYENSTMHRLGKDRMFNKERACAAVLNMVRTYLLNRNSVSDT